MRSSLSSGANAPRFRLQPVAVPGMSVQFFQNTALAPLDDVKVRQALLYLTDRAALVKAVFGEYSPVATGPLAAVTKCALGPTLSALSYPYDPEKGKALLAEAGWTDSDGDGVLDKDGEKLVLKGVLMSWGELPAIGTILQAQWKAAGVQLDLEQMPYPAALEAGRKRHASPGPVQQLGHRRRARWRTFFHGKNIGAFNWSRVDDRGRQPVRSTRRRRLSKTRGTRAGVSGRPAPRDGRRMDPAHPRPGEPERGVGAGAGVGVSMCRAGSRCCTTPGLASNGETAVEGENPPG